jgi:Xaa-Pro aminopeptidase
MGADLAGGGAVSSRRWDPAPDGARAGRRKRTLACGARSARCSAPPETSLAPSLRDECAARLARFRETLASRGLDGALLLWAADVYYLAGTRQSAALWVPAAGEPALLVRKSLPRARAESPLADVRPFPPSRELAPVFAGARRVGLELDVVPFAVHRFWSRAIPGAEIVDVGPALRDQRSAKSPGEMACMREAGRLLAGVYAQVPGFLRAGMRELDAAAEIEARLRRAGSEGNPRIRAFNQEVPPGVVVAGASAEAASSFDGPVTGGGISPSAPLGPSAAPIPPDAPVILDYTAMAGGYFVDVTRVAVCGRLAPALQRALDLARSIQDEVASGLRPGAIPSRLWARALEMAAAAGPGASFMGPPDGQVRFVGHGVGLELDELPVLAPGFDEPLRAGQTLAVEPKFVLPGLGAVGIENTWAVAEGGGERLTEFPDDVLRA